MEYFGSWQYFAGFSSLFDVLYEGDIMNIFFIRIKESATQSDFPRVMKDTSSRRFQTYFLPHYCPILHPVRSLSKSPCNPAWIYIVKSVIWTGAEAINKYVDTIILSKHPATADSTLYLDISITVSRYIYNYLHPSILVM